MHLLRALQLVIDSLHIALHSADLVGLVRERFCRGQRNLLRLLQQLQRVLGSIDRFSLWISMSPPSTPSFSIQCPSSGKSTGTTEQILPLHGLELELQIRLEDLDPIRESRLFLE